MGTAPCDELIQVWDGRFVVLSLIISTLGSFTSLTSAVYAFTVLRHPHLRSSFHAYMLSAGVAIGGIGVWGMHFIGMHALTLETCDGRPVQKTYNVALTLASFVAAVVVGTLVFYVVLPPDSIRPSGDAGGGAARSSRSSDGASSAQQMSCGMELCGHQPFVGKFATGRFALASLLLAMGASVMHYMGMTAMYGPYTIGYDPVLVALSTLIAAVAASSGLFIVVQIAHAGLATYSIVMRVAAAIAISLAVNSMHYVGMFSAHYLPAPSLAENVNHGLGPNVQIHVVVVIPAAVAYCFAHLLAIYSHLTMHLSAVGAPPDVDPSMARAIAAAEDGGGAAGGGTAAGSKPGQGWR